jgi:hypothetical protein
LATLLLAANGKRGSDHGRAAPERATTIDGQSQVGWWRLHAADSEIIGVISGGRGQALAEKQLVSLQN